MSEAKQQHPLISQVRRVILKRGGDNGIRGLSRRFRIFDDNHDLKLNRAEFESGLKDYGVILAPEELTQVIKLFDTDGDGMVSVDEFITAVRGPMSARRREIVTEVFQRMDKNNSGVLDVEDIKGRYDVSKHPMVVEKKKTQDQVLKEFLNAFDGSNAPGDGLVTFQEWLLYYNGISANIDNDEMFEAIVTKAWNFGDVPSKRGAVRLVKEAKHVLGDSRSVGKGVEITQQINAIDFHETKRTFDKHPLPKRVVGYTGYVVGEQESFGQPYFKTEMEASQKESGMVRHRPPPVIEHPTSQPKAKNVTANATNFKLE